MPLKATNREIVQGAIARGDCYWDRKQRFGHATIFGVEIGVPPGSFEELRIEFERFLDDLAREHRHELEAEFRRGVESGRD